MSDEEKSRLLENLQRRKGQDRDDEDDD